MDSQEDITPRMRAILIDWLVEVHLKFKLVPSTLYLCVHLIDQYCTHNQVQRSRLQLVGITALLIACKYEEIYPPEVLVVPPIVLPTPLSPQSSPTDPKVTATRHASHASPAFSP